MIQIDLLATNGTSFDLRNGPVRLGAEGSEGILGLLKSTAFTRQSGSRDGQLVDGFQVPAQPLKLPLKWGTDYSPAETFEAIDSRLWEALLPTETNTLRVRDTVRGSVRTVGIRLEDDGYSMGFDPTDIEMDESTFSFVADDPWWRGQAITIPFGVGASQPFYGATGYGPPFYISPANSSGSQPVTNPGHAPAAPLWDLAGPISAFVLNVGGSILDNAAANILQGEHLYIDNDPAVLRAWRVKTDGTVVEETQNLATWGFTTIPKGTTRTVRADLTGTGVATMRIVPRFYRAV